MNPLKYAIIAATFSFPAAISAQNFISTDAPDKLFNFGVRLGVSSSNRTFSKDYIKQWNNNSWGTGFEAGIVLNLNMRDFFALQPGFFFESRSGKYSYSQEFTNAEGETDNFTQLGKYRTYNFIVPVMASFRFNLTGDVRWTVEAGPYAQFRFGSSGDDKIKVIIPQKSPVADLTVTNANSNSFDLGVKAGTGFTLKNKYSLYAHYLAGFRNVWQDPFEGGRNKAWTITLGYDF